MNLKNMNDEVKKAFLIITLFGLISLFGDIIYEGARGVNGPYLKLLGSNAALIGLIVGVAEFLGYGLRFVSGYFSDKTKSHWTFLIIGYFMLISVPLLSISNTWKIAAIFIVLERLGKALRSPARDTLVSFATKKIGTGIGFGISEFFDQIGATVGPLIFTIYFLSRGSGEKILSDYQNAYKIMLIPFLILISLIVFVYFIYKKNGSEDKKSITGEGLSKVFWIYSIFTFLTTFGFINFALMGFHMKSSRIVSDNYIPFFYAVAMVVDAIFAIIIGKLYDNLKNKNKKEDSGLLLLIMIPIITIFIIPLAFSYNVSLIFLSVILWGIVMGAHETIMKAAIADITSIKKRGTGYGVFNFIYGLSFFLGSSFVGILYEFSKGIMLITLIIFQFLSIFAFYILKKNLS